ncbi:MULTISPECIES: ABC transporter ATP-binding protein [unclassified Bradyrhizobium]|uniref:ABC transporter ATP-binding protein n=1 Tax=unclassified Bradyrhizobium TaxID=2631580 RepID=UPI002916FEEB|nr:MULTISPECIES: ABC transporter ATP-binding protein [unclassified Bradyrhizobium]
MYDNLLVQASLMVAMALVSSVLEVSIPGAIGRLIRSVEQGGQVSPTVETTVAFGFLMAAWFVGPLFNRAYGFVKAYTTPRLRQLATQAIVTYVAYRARSVMDQLTASVVNKSIELVSKRSIDFVNLMLLHFVRATVVLVGSGAVIWSGTPAYAPAFVVFLLLFVGTTLALARICWRLAQEAAEAAGAAARETAEFVNNIGLIRACNAQQREILRLDAVLSSEAGLDKRLHVFLAVLRTSQFAVSSGFMTIISWWCVRDAAAGRISTIELTVILSVGIVLTNVITNLGDHLIDLFEASGEMRQALEYLSRWRQDASKAEAGVQVVAPGSALSIEFRSVGFGYRGQPDTLKNVNLTINANERVGIVGRSGAGKTTLLRLASGQLRADSGAIFIGGVDIAHMPEQAVNELVFLVEQQPSILSRSLLDNLRFGRPNAAAHTIEAAAREASCLELIERNVAGYGALLGEGGARLSSGEKQRVAVARAIIRNPRILLVDEATSALDARSEAQVLKALDRFYRDRTVIVVAHRLDVMMSMDRIIVLDDGEILEEGPHEELVHAGGLYAELWARQHAQAG